MSNRTGRKVAVSAILAYFLVSCGGGGGAPAGLLFELASLVNAVVGQAYNATLTVNGGTGPYTFTVTGTLPAGLTACDTTPRANCPITGTPTTWSATLAQITVSVSDSSNPPMVAQKVYSLKVDPVGGVLQIQPAALPNGVLNTAYSGQITVGGGKAGYIWTLSSGTLPTGVSFCTGSTGTTCALTGTPTANGTYTFTVQVTDSNSPAQSIQKQYTVVISATPPTQATLTMTVNGSGTATSNPAGISCPPTCAHTFSGGTSVELDLSSANGWEFDSWAGCNTEDGATCTMNMSSDQAVTANFYQLTAPTTTLPGTLALPAGLNPSDFDVGNQYASVTPDGSGHFSIPVSTEGVTFTAAAPKNQPDSDVVWVAVTLMTPGQPQPTSVAIDTNSTARGILLLFPMFGSPDPYKEKVILDTMDTVPEVQALANLVAQDFPTTLHPLTDVNFQNAYVAAADAVAGALPSYVQLASTAPAPEPPAIPAEVLQNSGPRIQLHRMDSRPQLDYAADSGNKIKISTRVQSLIIGGPLDMYVSLWQIDPYALQSLMAGANQVGTFQLKSVDAAMKRNNEPDTVAPRFPEFVRLGSSIASSRAVVSAESTFKYLDFFDDIVNGIKSLIGVSTDREKLTLATTNNSAYIIRGVNGRFTSGRDPGEWDFMSQNYRDERNRAVALNVMNGAMDFTSIFIDMKKLADTCPEKVFADVLLKSEQSLNGAQVSEDYHFYYPLLMDIGKTTAKKLLECAFKNITKHPPKSLAKWGDLAADFINVPKKISKIGALSERICALSGSPTCLTPAPVFTTPMDSAIVVVGNPFSPTVQTINGVDPTNLPSPLPCVHTDDPLTIVGTGFKRQPNDPDPRLLITDEVGNQVEVKNFTMTASTGSPPTYTIQTTLPEQVGGRLRFTLIQYGQTDTPEILEVCPIITGISPVNYFRTDPDIRHRTVRITGKGFLPSGINSQGTRDAWVRGSDTYSPTTATYDYLEFTALPQTIAVGIQEVKVKYRAADPPVGATPPIYFRVLGPPSVTSVNPGNVYPYQEIAIGGTNFGEHLESPFVHLQSAFESSDASPREIIWNPDTAADQTATIYTFMSMAYHDPTPATPDQEPMPAQLKVVTLEGESVLFNFNVIPFPAAPMNRTITLPYETPDKAFNFASQNPAPAGNVSQAVVCDLPGGYGDCHITYPGDYAPLPNPNGHGQLVGGINAAAIPPANGTCNGAPVSCFGDSSIPPTWENVPAQNINNSIGIDENSAPSGTIVLDATALSGAHLRGPNVNLNLSPSSPNWHVTGGGIVIDATTDGKYGRNGLTQQIGGTLTIDSATGTVVTIQNARGVSLQVNITGAQGAPFCDTGVLIQNSVHVTINGTIANCDHGIVAQNSDDVNISLSQLYGYKTAGVTFDGVNNSKLTTVAGYQVLNGNSDTIIVPSGQQIGYLIKGGSSGNLIVYSGTTMLGNQTAIWLQDSANNFVTPRIGAYFLSNGSVAMTDSIGNPVNNQVGIRISNGATGNAISPGISSYNCPSGIIGNANGYVVMADIGMLVEGGTQNTVCGVYFGDIGKNTLGTDSNHNLGNRIGLQLKGTLATQPLNNVIRDNHFNDNTQYGVEIDGATQVNTFKSNYFANAAPRNPPQPDPANHICGLHVTNLSKNVQFNANLFTGEIIGACLDNADGVQFVNNIIKNTQDTGIKMQNSQNVSFSGDQIISDNNSGQSGMHIIASGAYRIVGLQVKGIGGTGIDIEQPPAAPMGVARVQGEDFTAGTISGSSDRADFLAPFFLPPFQGAASKLLAVTNNTGVGIFVHNGAQDVSISEADVNGNGAQGILLDNTGPDVRIENSRIGYWDVVGAPNNGDGIRVQNNTAADVFIGTPGKGNLITHNNGWGIQVLDSEHIAIQNNLVSTLLIPLFYAGMAPNALGGILLKNTDDVVVGGNNPKAGNIISGNTGDGIRVQDFRNFPSPPIQIEGNLIGTGVDGQAEPVNNVGNTGYGINLVGTPPKPDIAISILNNVIGGNTLGGVHTQNWGTTNGPTLETNVIGQWPLDATRTSPPNAGPGVSLDTSDKGILRLNHVGANQGNGVELSDSSGNLISLNTVQNQTADGIALSNNSDDNTLGLNTIKGNAGIGVFVTGTSKRDAITQNSITADGAKGIDLDLGGQGGNNEIPAPIIRFIGKGADGKYSFFGDVPLSVPAGSTVELYVDEDDEGRIFLASTASINHGFSFYGIPEPAGETFTGKNFHATVTDPTNNTSEFGPTDPDLTIFAKQVASQRAADIALTTMSTKATSIVSPNPATDQDPAVCQDAGGNKYLAFSTNRDGNFEIYLTTPSGNPMTRLTNNTTDDIEPNFSADCSKIAFVSNRDGNYEIYTMHRDGTNVTRLTNDPGDDRQPDWSPDGSKIVFSSNRGGAGFQIYIMNSADGSAVTRISTLAGSNGYPAWKKIPDKIAYQNCTSNVCQIVVLTLSLNFELPVGHSGSTDEQPDWFVTSGGDQYLIVASRLAGTTDPYHLYLMTPDGYLLLEITPADKSDTSPSCCFGP